MRKLVMLVVLAVVGVGVAATGAGAMGAPPPPVPITSCGQVITADAVLRADLVCSGNAVIVEGSNLTVRLSGHSITSSDGTGTGIQLGNDAPQACVSNVTVRGGQISGFAKGLANISGCPPVSGDTIAGTTLSNNTFGLSWTSPSPLAADHISLTGPNGIGPLSPSAGPVDVTRSTMQIATTTGVAVANGGTIDSSLLQGGTVLVVANDNQTISNSHLSGVTLNCSDADLVISNSQLGNTHVSGSQACGVSLTGDRIVGPWSGVFIALQSANFPATITDSVFIGWDTAVRVTNAFAVSITGNTFRYNGTGVATCSGVGCSVAGTVSNNHFVNNTGTGLLLSAGTWHVGSNVAVRNGGLGIDAEGAGLTVIDDGGNSARHNQPPQCVGVVCTTSVLP